MSASSSSRVWPQACGEMAERIRACNWAATPLGPCETWPQSLRSAIDIALDCGFASYVWWGRDLVQLYNDAALPVLHAMHPSGLGAPAQAAWSDVWETVGPLVEQVLRTGQPVIGQDMPINAERGGSLATVYFTFCYRPLRDEAGAVAGVLLTAVETTGAVRVRKALRESERRLARQLNDARQLQQLSGELIPEQNPAALYERFLDAMVVVMRSDAASIQRLNHDTNDLELIAWRGFDPASAEFWKRVDLDSASSCGEALRTRQRIIVADIDACSFMSGTADLDAYHRSGLRAVQSTPLVSRSGRSLGMISTHRRKPCQPAADDFSRFDILARQAADLVERTQAELALRESEERFRAVANLVPDLLWCKEIRAHADWYNRRWLEYTGQTAEEASGEGWLDVVHPDDRAASRICFRHAIKAGEPLEHEHRIRRAADGTYRWFLVRAEPVRDASGAVFQWVGAATDIHEQRMALDALRESERRQQVLMAELQHRVNNVLAMVRVIAFQTLATTETLDDFHESFEGRLNALGRAQHLLVNRDIEAASLSELIEHELTEYGGRLGETVTVDGPDVRLRPKAVQTLAMVLHELTVNAVKYGALSPEVPAGRIAVAWAVEPAGTTPEAPPRLLVRWTESGVPRVDPNPTRRGQGRELIEVGLAHELKGAEVQLEFRRGGVRCTFDIPLRPDIGNASSMVIFRDDDSGGEG